MARFGFCAASSLIWGGGGGWGFAVPFLSVQDCSPWAHKKILRGGNIKTKSAAVAFFFPSIPFFLLALSIFSFLVLL